MEIINIHICNDQKFINQFKYRFEEINSGSSFYFIKPKFQKLKFIEQDFNIHILNAESVSDSCRSILSICKSNKINIFVHYLDPFKAELIYNLRSKISFKTYWIFYGSDLYSHLYNKGSYQLFDSKDGVVSGWVKKIKYKIRFSNNKNFVHDFVQNLDFFCFWNLYDFKLLKENFKTSASFKYFIYDDLKMEGRERYDTKSRTHNVCCLVNHSGSRSGNHIKILGDLKTVSWYSNINKVIVPLSYGKPGIINTVHEFCQKHFQEKYYPLLEFLKKEDYFTLLEEVDIAIFGHRRQEAGFNIIYLLILGVKVYLREKNNLLEYFNSIGVKVFNFDKNFESIHKFEPLSIEDQISNRNILLTKFSEDSVDEMYKNLMENELD